MKKYSFVFFIQLFCTALAAQINMADYAGQWEGLLPNSNAFHFELELNKERSGYMFIMKNGQHTISTPLEQNGEMFSGSLRERQTIVGYFNEDKSEFRGFIQSGILQYNISIKKGGSNQWNMLMVREMLSRIYLSIEDAEGENYSAYPFFQDNRFTGTWCGNFQKEGNKLYFSDFKTGLNFEGIPEKEKITLKLLVADKTIAEIPFQRSTEEWSFGHDDIGLRPGYNLPERERQKAVRKPTLPDVPHPEYLKQLTDSIVSQTLTQTHAVVISHKGENVYEKYFSAYQEWIPHDQRSASKSIASAMIGIAIDQGIIPSDESFLHEFLPEEYAPKMMEDGRKAKIRIKDLLTMSSGLDAVDFGVDRNSAASEGNYQNSPDWLNTVLNANMINEPGKHALYGSAKPYLLGVALNQKLDIPLAIYMDQQLFAKLGVDNYIIQNDISGVPYFGGGMYLMPKDMLKFGQLYLNNGVINGEKLISKEWINKSFERHLILENTNDKNPYGYLWWHKDYEFKGRTIASIEARGSGGQYIMVVPELELVVAITSGNFRNGRFWQPELILEKYILPAFIN